jgi:hypothetical protein
LVHSEEVDSTQVHISGVIDVKLVENVRYTIGVTVQNVRHSDACRVQLLSYEFFADFFCQKNLPKFSLDFWFG